MDKDLVRQGYNRIAASYQAGRDQFQNLGHLDRLAGLLRPESNVLDIGCGAGVPVDKYLVGKGHRVIGIDIAERQVELARLNVPQAEYEVKDMSELEAEEYRVDAVVSFYAVFHIPREEHQSLFDRLNSFLSEGGLLMVTMGAGEWEGTEDNFHGTTMWWSHYGAEKNREIVKKAGFEILWDEIDCSGGERHLILLGRKR